MLYWSWSQAKMYTSHDEVIPADAVRVPMWLFVVIAPLLGAAFVVFLPIAGFLTTIAAGADLLRKVWSEVSNGLADYF